MRDSFFPKGSLDTRPDLDKFTAEWFSSYLERMEEPPLYPPSAALSMTFRLLCLPTWDHPSVVRIEAYGTTWRLLGKQTNGDGGFEAGRIDRRERRLLTQEEANRVAGILPYLRFWELPAFTEDDGCDGTTWVLEGVNRGRYHVVHRWMPEWGDTFGEFCLMLLGLCEFGRGESWGVA
jgi:hypothetical protein